MELREFASLPLFIVIYVPFATGVLIYVLTGQARSRSDAGSSVPPMVAFSCRFSTLANSGNLRGRDS